MVLVLVVVVWVVVVVLVCGCWLKRGGGGYAAAIVRRAPAVPTSYTTTAGRSESATVHDAWCRLSAVAPMQGIGKPCASRLSWMCLRCSAMQCDAVQSAGHSGVSCN